MAPAPTTPSFLRPPQLPRNHRVRFPLPPPSASFRLAEILGGRGLCNGEVGISKELSSPSPPPPSPPPSTPAVESPSPSIADEPPAVGPDAFEKEMMGLTGGFPGGEVGLKDFVAKNPPPRPPKRTQEPASTTTAVVRPRAPELPLFLPGMVVLVKNPANAYHMYCGIVQRVTDGRVGVLFEGGNWDRLITFGVGELEGREKGPPMVNPKSVVLEALVQDAEVEAEKKDEAVAAAKP